MMVNVDNIIATIKKYFDEQADITTVYLFGSAVKCRLSIHSDIDIAVLFTENINVMERFERKLHIVNKLEKLIGIKVDIVDLYSADAYFVHQIMLQKRILIDRSLNRRVDFEVNSRRTYFDMQPFYKLFHEQALNRLERMYRNG